MGQVELGFPCLPFAFCRECNVYMMNLLHGLTQFLKRLPVLPSLLLLKSLIGLKSTSRTLIQTLVPPSSVSPAALTREISKSGRDYPGPLERPEALPNRLRPLY